MTDEPELTILTVGIEKHYGYIRRQLQMIDALNPGADFRFLVVDNAAQGAPQLEIADPRCEVLAGIDPEPLPLPGRGSYHHAAALNMAVRRVTTRYALVIDPDLFVVYRHWIAECLAHVKRRGLGFFGAPWHPRWYRKWRDFPCVHFLLIDLHQAPAAELDFTPAIVEDREKDERPLAQWLKAHASLAHARMLIETRRDTGWKLRQRFGRIRSELILPVVDLDAELSRPKHLQTGRGRWLERLAPRRWRFLPADGTWLAPEDAPGFAADAFDDLQPEKFVWRGAPFAFHMRRNVRDRVFGRHDQDLEEPDLAAVLAEAACGGPWPGWRLDPPVR
ncbi:MAG TPA: glycosyltransferase family A protein [Caulobacteraceae bacterium]